MMMAFVFGEFAPVGWCVRDGVRMGVRMLQIVVVCMLLSRHGHAEDGYFGIFLTAEGELVS